MRILLVSPHPDDIELCAGGTVLRMRDKHDFACIGFSECNIERLAEEWYEAMDYMGIKHLLFNNYQVRKFNDVRQEILDDLIRYGKQFEPDLIIGPSPHDRHQDHQVVASEMIRAFGRTKSILMFEHPHGMNELRANTFVEIDERVLSMKVAALRRYKSQQDRDYFTTESIRARALFYGGMAGVRYAEAFWTYRMVI